MLTRIIIIYIALPLYAVAGHGAQNWPFKAQVARFNAGCDGLGLLAQTGGDYGQSEQLEQSVGHQRHQGSGNGPGEDGRHVIQ
jgi:hypothetical protein